MIKPLEQAIAKVAPGVALRRAVDRHNLRVFSQYNAMMPGYKGGQPSRRRRLINQSATREDLTGNSGDYQYLISAAMNLYRNDPLTRSIVDVVTTYMGESRPLATTSDEVFNDAASSYFNDYFWRSADSRRRPGVDYGTFQKMWTKYSWVGGDMLFALREDGLYPYEGIQIATPFDLRADKQIVNGVRIQASAPHRITHYYVIGHKGGRANIGRNDYQRIRESQAIFAPSQYWRSAMLRGVPELHGVVDKLQDFDETNENVQSKIKFESMIFSVEKKGAIGNLPGRKVLDTDSALGEQVEYSEVEWGARFKTPGDPDKDFKLTNMNTPSQEHVPYMEFTGRLIAAGCGLPYEIVMHLYTNGSYTANRAARTDFAKFTMDRWLWRNKVLNQRVYNWVIARAIKHGEIPAAPIGDDGRSEWHKCQWTLPHFPQIDEGKKAQAYIKQWQSGTKSLADIAQEQNRTRTQLLDGHDADLREIKYRARKLGVSMNMYSSALFDIGAEPELEEQIIEAQQSAAEE